MARKPLGVRMGRDPILTTLHQQDRCIYLPDVKAPWRHVSDVVIDHSAQATSYRPAGNTREPGPFALERGLIRWSELLGVEPGGCETLLERCAPSDRRAQFRSTCA